MQTGRMAAALSIVAQVGVLGGCGGADAWIDGDGAVRASDGQGSHVVLPDAGAQEAGAPLVPAMLIGKVVPPPGRKALGLKVHALYGAAACGADGQFQVMGVGGGQQLLIVRDENGNPLLFGWGKPGQMASLSTRSTAAFLLFLFTGATRYPTTTWERVATLALESPESARLAVLLDQKLVGNPAFLTMGRSEDREALAAAVGARLRAIAPHVARIAQPLVLVDPTAGGDSKSGITVLVGNKDGQSTADVNQITFMNERRRRSQVFIERNVGTKDRPVYREESDFELPATAGFNGVFGSLGDVLVGSGTSTPTGAYVPIYYGPVGLGRVFSEEDILRYRVRVAGPGLRPRNAGTLSQLQQQKHALVVWKGLLGEMFIPVMCAFLPGDVLDRIVKVPGFTVFARDLFTNIYSGNLSMVGQALTAGDYAGAYRMLTKYLAEHGELRQWFLEEFRVKVYLQVLNQYDSFLAAKAAAEAVLKIFTVVDRVLAVADFDAVRRDWDDSAEVEDWEVTVRAPKVFLSPAMAEMSCGEKTTFDAVIKNGGQRLRGDFIYAFTNTARFGTLTTAKNSTYKNNFEVSSPTVDYAVNPGETGQGRDEITVETFALVDDPRGGKQMRQSLGVAKAKVIVSNECTNSAGYVGSGGFTSGCTMALGGPASVKPGQEVTVTAQSGFGGVCGNQPFVWMSFAVSARLDGGPEMSGRGGAGIYDFCYGGGPQPMVPAGAGVVLPDGKPHTITFKIDPKIQCPVCVREVLNGSPCSSNAGNRQNIRGPALVMSSDRGGTHGWSTVRFFTVNVDKK